MERQQLLYLTRDDVREVMHYESVPIGCVKMANKNLGHHFFDPDTMRFFRSRTARTAHKLEAWGPRHINGDNVGNPYNAAKLATLYVFVTSEQNSGLGYCYPRMWTARYMLTIPRLAEDDYRSCTMGEVPGTDFQQFGGNAAARRTADRWAREMSDSQQFATFVNSVTHYGTHGPAFADADGLQRVDA